jgi:hypothetical protein
VPTPGLHPLPKPPQLPPRAAPGTVTPGVYQGGRYGQAPDPTGNAPGRAGAPGFAAKTPANNPPVAMPASPAGVAPAPASAPVVPPVSAARPVVPPIARQRSAGTVYGGQTGLPTSSNAEAPLEVSGSLTGMILSRGRSEAQLEAHRKKERRSRWRTGVLIGLGTLAFFGLLGLVVAVLAGDFIQTLIKTLTK